MLNTAVYNTKMLQELAHDLTMQRDVAAEKKADFDELKEKRTLFIESLVMEISREKGFSVAKSRGMIATHKKYTAFTEVYNEARREFLKEDSKKRNLECQWETCRTIIADNRKERWNKT